LRELETVCVDFDEPNALPP